MAWKTERWLQELFPGKEKIYSEYRALPRRELAIVAAAVLDAALAELLTMRLLDDEKECHDFLGVSGDSRSPCASLGARIQLAYLIRLITKDDVTVLRMIKNIRNAFAHRVNADFTSPEVLPLIRALNSQFRTQSNRLIDAGVLNGARHEEDVIGPHLTTIPEAGAGLLLAVFTVYHAYLHRMSESVNRIGNPLKSPN